MRCVCIIIIYISFISREAFAQHSAGQSTVSGVNGFRTVAEENALMEKTLAERRKQEKLENNPQPYVEPEEPKTAHFAKKRVVAHTTTRRKKK